VKRLRACSPAPNQAIRISVVNKLDAVMNAEANLFLSGATEPRYTLPTSVYKTKRPLSTNLLPTVYRKPGKPRSKPCSVSRNPLLRQENSPYKAKHEVRLRLLEETIPREEGFSMPDVVLETPHSPKNGVLLPPNARQALIAAFETAEQGEPGRYALHHVRLQGGKASLAATDGRLLLIQGGFHWPFAEYLLLGNYRTLFRWGEFPEGPLEVSMTERQFVFRGGTWEFFLPIEESQRYPNVELVLPSPVEVAATLEVSSGDAQYVRDVLPHLPSDEFDYERPVTIDLNGKIGVRSRSMKIPHGIEVVLRNSSWRGAELLCAMKRAYLQRALELGLRQFQFFSTGCAPVVVREGEKTYCWATYHPDSIVKATSQTELRESPVEVKSVTRKTFWSSPDNAWRDACSLSKRCKTSSRLVRRAKPKCAVESLDFSVCNLTEVAKRRVTRHYLFVGCSAMQIISASVRTYIAPRETAGVV
jgi:hypothetical protein